MHDKIMEAGQNMQNGSVADGTIRMPSSSLYIILLAPAATLFLMPMFVWDADVIFITACISNNSAVLRYIKV